jgi:hypothetical protein
MSVELICSGKYTILNKIPKKMIYLHMETLNIEKQKYTHAVGNALISTEVYYYMWHTYWSTGCNKSVALMLFAQRLGKVALWVKFRRTIAAPLVSECGSMMGRNSALAPVTGHPHIHR